MPLIARFFSNSSASSTAFLPVDAHDFQLFLRFVRFFPGFSAGTYLVAAHSEDSLDRPLDSYRYAEARFLHIEAIRTEVQEEVYETYLGQSSCFPYLYGGGGESADER